MSAQPSPSPDVVFDLLADADRRAVLTILREHGALDERALARRVADRRDVTAERVRDVQVALWHVHLPKLDGAALVDHDDDAGRVEPGPALAAVEPLLAYVEDHESDAGTTV